MTGARMGLAQQIGGGTGLALSVAKRLTATPAAGYQFSGWSGACTGNGACSVLMNASKNVTATFTPALPTTCDEKIKDLQGKVAGMKHPWWHDHQLKTSLKMYAESLAPAASTRSTHASATETIHGRCRS